MLSVVAYSASPVETRDLASIRDLASRSFGIDEALFGDMMETWAERNPSWTPDMPKGFVLRSPQDEVIGYVANIPSRYVVDGRLETCVSAGSLCVSDDYRGQGLAKILGRAFLEEPGAALRICAGSTPAAYRMWLGLGMQETEKAWRAVPARVLCDGGELATDLMDRALHMRVPGLARVGDVVTRQLQTLGKPASKALRVEPVTTFLGAEFSPVADFVGFQGARTYSYRDEQSLEWMAFGSEYLRESRVALAAYSGDLVVGYLLMKKVGKTYFLIETRCRDADPDIAHTLILAARDYAAARHATGLTIWVYSPMVHEALPSLSSVWWTPAEPITHCYQHSGGALDTPTWEITPGDGDLCVN